MDVLMLRNLVVMIASVIAFGAFVAVAGALLRRKRNVTGLAMLVCGLLLVAAASGLAWSYRQELALLFENDYQADTEKVERLRNTDLVTGGEHVKASNEWPQWRGEHRDGISPETGLLAEWPKEGPPVAWRQPIKGGFSAVAIANGRAYTMDKAGNQERVLCFDAATGKELWVHAYDVSYSALDYGSGPRATPTVHDGRVYTVGATGTFLCLKANPEDGQPKVLWKHDLLQEFGAELLRWGVACSPLVDGDHVIVQPGGTNSSVVAFDRVKGDVAWKALSDRSGYSSPVLTDAAGVHQVVCFTGKGVAGLRASDGGSLWYFPWTTAYDCNVATPIVAGNYVFISSDYQAGCALLSLSPAGSGGVREEPIYVRHDKLMRNHFSTCVLHQNHLYGFDVTGHGAVGFLKCVDLRKAEEKWSTRFFQRGSVMYADGHVIVLAEDGVLGLVEATPEGFHKKSSFQLFHSGQCWAPPALAGGRLYVRDGEEIVCLDLKQPKGKR